MLEHLSELLVAVITMLGSLGAIYLKHVLDLKASAKADPFVQLYNNDKLLYNKLDELLTRYAADRAYIVQYHNGSYFKSGISMMRYSITHEVVAPGISREQLAQQNVLLGIFSDAVKRFFAAGYYHEADVEAMDEVDAAKGSFLARGVKSIYTFPLRDLNGQWLGALCLNYVSEAHVLTTQQLEPMSLAASQISGYLKKA